METHRTRTTSRVFLTSQLELTTATSGAEPLSWEALRELRAQSCHLQGGTLSSGKGQVVTEMLAVQGCRQPLTGRALSFCPASSSPRRDPDGKPWTQNTCSFVRRATELGGGRCPHTVREAPGKSPGLWPEPSCRQTGYWILGCSMGQWPGEEMPPDPVWTGSPSGTSSSSASRNIGLREGQHAWGLHPPEMGRVWLACMPVRGPSERETGVRRRMLPGLWPGHGTASPSRRDVHREGKGQEADPRSVPASS